MFPRRGLSSLNMKMINIWDQTGLVYKWCCTGPRDVWLTLSSVKMIIIHFISLKLWVMKWDYFHVFPLWRKQKTNWYINSVLVWLVILMVVKIFFYVIYSIWSFFKLKSKVKTFLGITLICVSIQILVAGILRLYLNMKVSEVTL